MLTESKNARDDGLGGKGGRWWGGSNHQLSSHHLQPPISSTPDRPRRSPGTAARHPAAASTGNGLIPSTPVRLKYLSVLPTPTEVTVAGRGQQVVKDASVSLRCHRITASAKITLTRQRRSGRLGVWRYRRGWQWSWVRHFFPAQSVSGVCFVQCKEVILPPSACESKNSFFF